jgi:hypothetical protein
VIPVFLALRGGVAVCSHVPSCCATIPRALPLRSTAWRRVTLLCRLRLLCAARRSWIA